MGATVVEGLLLLRVLTLKLHRVYLFITLYCVLNLLFDAASWYFGWESAESSRIFEFSLFFFAPLYPLAAWETFEESKSVVGKLRRAQMIRLVSGLLVTCLCALLISLYVEPADTNGNSLMLLFTGVFLLTGSASACAAFLWFMYRFSRANKIPLAYNTAIWIYFFIVSLSLQIADCMTDFIRSLLPQTVTDIAAVALLSFDLVLMAWCIVRLKPVPSGAPSAPEKARLE